MSSREQPTGEEAGGEGAGGEEAIGARSGGPAVVPLVAPAGGLPPVVDTVEELERVARRLEAGTGPVALDAERAGGFRYTSRAYLIQLRRAGAGTFLIDPVPIATAMGPLARALDGPEWVLHAASQDLGCLAELGLVPASLFDTELAGRLLGYERVGLAAIVERTLNLGLSKGHGADDWSRRPLPAEWLVYAALDVEVLLELRSVLAQQLDRDGKTRWAHEEFDHVRLAGGPRPKPDRWRRTSGIHTLRRPRQLAAVREMWSARDRVAAQLDSAPGRVLPDSAITAAVVADPATVQALTELPVFGGRAQRRRAGTWFDALHRARTMPDDELPPVAAPHDGPPPANRWAEKDSAAHARLAAARTALKSIGERHSVPVENLLLPDLLRRVCWEPPDPLDRDGVDAALSAGGARPWQRELLVDELTVALTASAAAPGPSPASQDPSGQDPSGQDPSG